MYENVCPINFIGAHHAPFLKQKNTCYFIKESPPIWTFLVFYFLWCIILEKWGSFWTLLCLIFKINTLRVAFPRGTFLILFFQQCTVWEKWTYWHVACAYRKICNVISGIVFAGVGRLHIFSFSRFTDWCMSYVFFYNVNNLVTVPMLFLWDETRERNSLGFKFMHVTAKLIIFPGSFLEEEHHLPLPFSSTEHSGETMGEMFHFRVKL